MIKNYTFILLSALCHFVNAQLFNSFEGTPGNDFSSPACFFYDNNNTAHELDNFNSGCGLIYVKELSSTPILGYTINYSPSANATNGFSDGDFFGVASASGLSNQLAISVANGTQAFLMEDTDGTVTMEFDIVELNGGTPNLSLQYYLEATTWESLDFFKVEVVITDCPSATIVTVLSVNGIDIENGVVPEDTWNTLNQNLTSYNVCNAQLVISFDSNSASEEVAIDNIQFSSGSILSNENFTLDKSVSLFPNPSNSGNFILKNNGVPIKNINVSDMNGRKVYNIQLNGLREDRDFNLGLNTGLYFIKVESENASTIKKLIVH